MVIKVIILKIKTVEAKVGSWVQDQLRLYIQTLYHKDGERKRGKEGAWEWKEGKTTESAMKSCILSDQRGLKFTIHSRQRIYKLNTLPS